MNIIPKNAKVDFKKNSEPIKYSLTRGLNNTTHITVV